MPTRKKKIGRPIVPKREYRGEVFSLRLKAEEAKNVRRAIETANEKPSEWMREALLEKAARR
jgi:hypothetical protein